MLAGIAPSTALENPLICSPYINAGTNESWMTNAVDLDGNLRIQQGLVDMGAYEWFPRGTVLMLQ